MEAVKEILTESKVPLTYHLLMTKLNHMCPNHHLSQHEVEVMLEACPDIYYGGRHIGYGLKSWSKTTEILKNGRISDAAIEILRHETEPITIKSLLRKLSAHRAIVNFTTGFEDLKSEKNKSIAFFKGGYVALQKNPADSAVDDVDDDDDGNIEPPSEHAIKNRKYYTHKYVKYCDDPTVKTLMTKWTDEKNKKLADKYLTEYMNAEEEYAYKNHSLDDVFVDIGKHSVCYPVAFTENTAEWSREKYGKLLGYAHAGEIYFVVTPDTVYFDVSRHF